MQDKTPVCCCHVIVDFFLLPVTPRGLGVVWASVGLSGLGLTLPFKHVDR